MICMSNPKEPFFFEKEYQSGLDHYWQKYFIHFRNETFVGEARHRNLYLPYVPKRIRNSFPDAKLIVIVRNPVERAYSAYMHRRLHGFERLPFGQAINKDLERIELEQAWGPDEIEQSYLANWHQSGMNLKYRTYVDSGYYGEQIERYLDYFGRDQLLIISFDEFVNNPLSTYYDILGFLDENLLKDRMNTDLSPQNVRQSRLANKLAFLKSTLLIRVLRGYLPGFDFTGRRLVRFTTFVEQRLLSKDKMEKQTRSFLISHFACHNRKLESLTGWNLSSWNS